MKPRSERLLPAVDQAHQRSEQALQQLGEQQSRLSTAQKQLAELQRYREEYARTRHGAAMAVHVLLNHQQFIDRIDGAIGQQIREVARRERQLELAGSAWRQAHAREQALDTVIRRASHQERQVEERREQSDVDERMQHRPTQGRGRTP
jgi:flagellar FliJ protein